MNAGDCYCNKDWPRSTFGVLECLRAFSPALLSETNGGPSHLMPSVFYAQTSGLNIGFPAAHDTHWF